MDLFDTFIELLKSRFEKPKVLDVGCGLGNELRKFEENDLEAIGIDFAFEGEDIIKADFLEYDFGEEKFEGVFVKYVLHLFPKEDWEKFFDKTKRVLCKKGLVYFSLKVKDLGEEILRDLEGKGFEVVDKKIGDKEILGKRDFEVILGKR
ncbi:MAG: class I SAM-dependent methyltransferase [Nanoarchaeota archaeon]|nr:class I SAM-dependent methyltransferase [Nanoarchaeota archaeon]